MDPDRRRGPRYELLASIEVAAGDEVLILSVRNLSVTGVLVGGDGHDLASFVVGSSYTVVIFDPDDERYQVEVVGRVLRKPPDMMALTWDDEAALFQVQSLLARLIAKPTTR